MRTARSARVMTGGPHALALCGLLLALRWASMVVGVSDCNAAPNTKQFKFRPCLCTHALLALGGLQEPVGLMTVATGLAGVDPISLLAR